MRRFMLNYDVLRCAQKHYVPSSNAVPWCIMVHRCIMLRRSMLHHAMLLYQKGVRYQTTKLNNGNKTELFVHCCSFPKVQSISALVDLQINIV